MASTPWQRKTGWSRLPQRQRRAAWMYGVHPADMNHWHDLMVRGAEHEALLAAYQEAAAELRMAWHAWDTADRNSHDERLMELRRCEARFARLDREVRDRKLTALPALPPPARRRITWTSFWRSPAADWIAGGIGVVLITWAMVTIYLVASGGWGR